METQEKVKYSSQVVIIDKSGNIYLENNAKLGTLSFFGGRREGNETPIETAIRELKEELGIIFDRTQIKDGELQDPQVFSTGVYESTYFLLKINETEAKAIQKIQNICITTLPELKERIASDFPIEKSTFIRHVERAISNR